MATLLSQLHGKKTTRFLEAEVKPKGPDIDRVRKEVDRFVRFLHEFSAAPFKVSRVIEGGSLGKGTTVKNMSDIDLEVVFGGLTSIGDLQKNRKQILDALEKAVLRRQWGVLMIQTKRTKFSIQFQLNGVDIDVLPVFDVEKHVGSPPEIYTEMKKFSGGVERAAQEYSASFSELQIASVKPVDAKIKDVIRLLKFWKKTEGLDIPSYSIELLALHECRNSTSQSIDQLFRRCMGKLTCCHDICIVFDTNYDSMRYTKGRKAPFIMDPANPYMNTLDGTDIRAVTMSGNGYFREFYKNNPDVPSKRALTQGRRLLALKA